MEDLFKNRQEAGELLADEIKKKLADIQNGLILALPRGGVIVGAKIAKNLGWPLDIIVTRKIGSPGNPEYAIGAVSANTEVFGREFVSKQYLDEAIRKERQEIQRRILKYRGHKPALELKGKNVFLVDDGLATGLTMIAAIKEIRAQKPNKIIVVVPVAPPETVEEIKKMADEIIVLKIEPLFFAIGQFYIDFSQVSDLEVKELLKDY